MAKRRSVTACVKEIKALNTRFRKLKKKDGPLAERLCVRKDALIDEMIALCPHPSVIATEGAERYGVTGRPVAPRRICTRCGHVEVDGFDPGPKVLPDRPRRSVSVAEYLAHQGRILKRLGINL